MLTPIAISVGIYLAIAIGLILSQRPRLLNVGDGLKFNTQSSGIKLAALQPYTPRDGALLHYRDFACDTGPLVVMLHGSGWHGACFNDFACDLASRGVAHVLAPDLRGHGPNTSTRGDCSYIGQLSDDLDDLISQHRRADQSLIVIGHSSGGGLAIQHASGTPKHRPDHVVLLSPFIHYAAPTMRPNSGNWAFALTRRIIGLVMLNFAHIRLLNGLIAIQFNMPDWVKEKGGTDRYSYRLNASYAPRNAWKTDITNLSNYTLIVGSEDEAFLPDQFEPTLSALNEHGSYEIIVGATHLGLLDDPKMMANIINTITTYSTGDCLANTPTH
ncbi:putative alpha/beta hydrolase superfamily protein [Octadecabacter antarcticus 307]|uniref:Putative alpha/beta hydrolase superfamily protein n=1 Tax=Octadecabacter antarcticus 307 TaxID=391626 RepID=M9R0V2_9RHOB|nr:alpha/beta fold hydrolase [Octadecabacter antarcticus]AGI66289.1 putative alpha/beta hydrolase superfamily protein [Octadecabacter antarcticus 307]